MTITDIQLRLLQENQGYWALMKQVVYMDLGSILFRILFEYALLHLVGAVTAEKKRLLCIAITIVDHKEDGSWEFFSGNYLTKIKVTGLEEAIEMDVTVKEVANLPPGYSARRETTNADWIKYKKSAS